MDICGHSGHFKLRASKNRESIKISPGPREAEGGGHKRSDRVYHGHGLVSLRYHRFACLCYYHSDLENGPYCRAARWHGLHYNIGAFTQYVHTSLFLHL